jgi:hypothetical protein
MNTFSLYLDLRQKAKFLGCRRRPGSGSSSAPPSFERGNTKLPDMLSLASYFKSTSLSPFGKE